MRAGAGPAAGRNGRVLTPELDPAALDRIAAWLVDRGLRGADEGELLAGFCQRCQEAGLPLSRGLAIIDTLHPVYEGRAFRWRGDGIDEPAMIEFGRTTEGEAADAWRKSVFFHMLDTGLHDLAVDLREEGAGAFTNLRQYQTEGHAALFNQIHRFHATGVIGEMDCVYSSWCTRHPDGFRPDQQEALRRLVPSLALALKCVSLTRIAGTIVEVYLGRDAGRQVLSGRIQRGVADRISAVLWFSDLRGYTSISDRAEPEEILPLLNDYADAVISAIHEAGGSVLKLIGDGVLATFTAERPGEAATAALAAEADLRVRLDTLNARRAEQGRPVTEVYLGLHCGEVYYGNIGSEDRLDFTVIGPAVNEVSRIAALCRSVDRNALTSSDFYLATPEDGRARLVSVGRYALRGVGSPKDLYTPDFTG